MKFIFPTLLFALANGHEDKDKDCDRCEHDIRLHKEHNMDY